MMVPKGKRLKDEFENALADGRVKEASDLAARLEKLEPHNARWPHKLGDLLRRMGSNGLALAAYERAADRYTKGGFIARAVAMAKIITSMDPSRTDVLVKLEQGGAKSVGRKVGRGEGRIRRHRERAPLSQAAVLTPAADAKEDEVRFSDMPPAIELDIPLEFVSDLPTALQRVSVSLEAEEADSIITLQSEADRTAERLALLPLFTLFADVPRAALLVLASESELVELDPGAVVVRRGDPADALFGIVAGSVSVMVPGLSQEDPPQLGEGEVFGEACLLTDEPRHADVIVVEPLTALRTPKATLDRLVAQYAEVGNVLLNLLVQRLVALLFQTSPMFSALDFEAQREIVKLFEIRTANPGTALQQIGKRGDGLYIPLTGKLEVEKASGEIVVLPAGTVVGQRSLLRHAPSQATVRTVGDSVMLRLPSAAFMDLAAHHPTVLEQLATLHLDAQLGTI